MAYSAVCFVEIIDISIHISISIGIGAMAVRCLRFLRSLLFLFLFFPLFLSRGKVAAARKLENFCFAIAFAIYLFASPSPFLSTMES